jgi:hypothetical protein
MKMKLLPILEAFALSWGPRWTSGLGDLSEGDA